MISAGTYTGKAEDLIFEFRIQSSPDERVAVISGDVSRDDGADFVASFICREPQTSDDGRTLTGPIIFRGNPELFTGSLYLNADPRGVGTFQVGVDLDQGYQDIFAGRLDWQGSFLRRLVIEIDGIEGTKPPDGYEIPGRGKMTIERAFREVGFDATLTVDSFPRRGPASDRIRGYTLAEIHAAMVEKRARVQADRLSTHVFVCSYLEERGGRDVLGVMYDWGSADLNQRPREGVAVFYDHPMLSDPRVPEALRKREYMFTLVHEIGHSLNLLHSFDKSQPTSLSWMNYPHLYPRGYEAGQGYDGTEEFWRAFEERFDEDEVQHLLHASPREIRSGGFSFGVYEEGASIPFGGSANPRRTRLGANPLRATRLLQLKVGPVKPKYHLGEPVFLRIGAENVGADAVHVPDSLDPSEGYVRINFRTPSGRTMQYRPPVRMCKQAQLIHLPARESMPPLPGTPVFLSAEGPVFTEPGVYLVSAELTGVDGSKNVYSPAARIVILSPDDATEDFAHKLWDQRRVLEALYLRHPLAASATWNEVEEAVNSASLEEGNSTQSYFNYIAALGWMTPFAAPHTTLEKGTDLDKARKRMQRVDPRGLPHSVEQRRRRVLEGIGEKTTHDRSAPALSSARIVTRVEERVRAEVPPGGLFGRLGLAPRENGDRQADRMDPFKRIVSHLEGTRNFADVVSWNIEHLHAESNFEKIPKLAELIRSFRCDYWGLQEVDQVALARLVETINSSGRTRYDFVVVEGRGQQSGAIFRTDTTSVDMLPVPPGIFDEEIEVQLAGREGERERRPVFVRRQPLLCQVRVRQAGGASFDFRCAVVHLKSTDTNLKDKGNSLRAAAVTALGSWLQTDREAGAESDYLIMGDMNAETAQQGLQAFAEGEGLELLSVGMQEKYGKSEALTRVASQRLLDHIVVTSDAFTRMVEEDKEEQIIIRSDSRISNWTEGFSDHVPVAVRFVLAEDLD